MPGPWTTCSSPRGARRASSVVARTWWARASEPWAAMTGTTTADASNGGGFGGRTDRISAISAGPSARRSARMAAGRRCHMSSPIMRRRNPSAASSGVGIAAAWLPGDEPGHHDAHISGAS